MTTVLYMEDNPQRIRLMRRMLQTCRYDMLEAIDGEIGIELAINKTPDLILLNTHLSDEDGIEVVQHLRNIHSLHHVPIIAFTAHATSSKDNLLNAGFDGYLAKPIGKNKLLNMLSQFLGA